MAKASNESAPPKESAETPSAPTTKPKTEKAAPHHLDKYKTVLPNGLTVHNFV